MSPSAPTYYTYVDESIHQAADFIVTAAVFSATDLQESLAKALTTCGLQPLVDEYKSSSPKKNNSRDLRLRGEFHQILFNHDCKIGFAITDTNERAHLDHYTVELISDAIDCNDLKSASFIVNADEGIFNSKSSATKYPNHLHICPEHDSRQIIGIQLADYCAHSISMIIKQDLGLTYKTRKAWEGTGYGPDVDIDLAFEFWASMRYVLASPNLVSLPMANNEFPEPWMKPFGLHISEKLSPKIADAVKSRFGQIYLGCIH